MQVSVYDLQGNEKERIEIAKAFSEKVRPDLIQKAFLAEISLKRQKYGSDPLAGMRSSAHYHGRRGRRNSMMNREIARLRRVHGQGFLNLTARIVPQATKGRKAHPPKVEKNWKLRMNKKEKQKALRSALAATLDRNLVLGRGHKIDKVKLPIILVDDFQELKKTKEVSNVLEKIGLGEELERCKEKNVRAGKGKNRGRRYRIKKGPLVIIGKDKGVVNAVKNISGIDIILQSKIGVESLAPGAQPGRLVIWTKSAFESLTG